MIAPPPIDDDERARERVSAETQQIFTDTQRAVNAEIERLDAAQAWAEHEMDRITAAAMKDLDDGKDPTSVERQLQVDLKATIAKASAPDFDPRQPSPPAPSVTSPPASTPAVVPQATVPSPTQTEVAATPVEPPTAVAQTTSGCTCGPQPRAPDQSALAGLVLAIVLVRGRRGVTT